MKKLLHGLLGCLMMLDQMKWSWLGNCCLMVKQLWEVAETPTKNHSVLHLQLMSPLTYETHLMECQMFPPTWTSAHHCHMDCQQPRRVCTAVHLQASRPLFPNQWLATSIADAGEGSAVCRAQSHWMTTHCRCPRPSQDVAACHRRKTLTNGTDADAAATVSVAVSLSVCWLVPVASESSSHCLLLVPRCSLAASTCIACIVHMATECVTVEQLDNQLHWHGYTSPYIWQPTAPTQNAAVFELLYHVFVSFHPWKQHESHLLKSLPTPLRPFVAEQPPPHNSDCHIPSERRQTRRHLSTQMTNQNVTAKPAHCS